MMLLSRRSFELFSAALPRLALRSLVYTVAKPLLAPLHRFLLPLRALLFARYERWYVVQITMPRRLLIHCCTSPS